MKLEMGKAIRIVGTHNVKPSTGGATLEGGGGLPMSAWDMVYYEMYNKTVHFYKASAAGMFDTLRESLGRALAHFPPLAGRLHWAPGGARLQMDCNGKGVVLVEAECDDDLAYFQADLAPEKLVGLVPAIDFESTVFEERPLMFAQLTRLRCGGAALGLALCHNIVDGLSAFHFFTEWSRFARGEPLKEAPYLDRRVILSCARQGGERRRGRRLSFSDHVEFEAPPLLLGKQNASEEWNKETVKLALPLKEAQITELKATANSVGSLSRPYTRFEVITAHMWRCACKARMNKEEQPTAVYFVINIRDRIRNAPIPPRYFGNAVLKMNAKSRVGDLISSPLGFGCSKIREAIDMVDEDYIWSNVELLEEKEDISFYGLEKRVNPEEDSLYYGNPNLRVTSWLTMPIYDMDFGWGNPVFMGPIVRDLDGSSYMVPNPKYDGSIDVVLCLQVAHVDKFKKCFYEDISMDRLG